MAKPVILAVDDEPEVLKLVGRDIRQHHSWTYRVVGASPGREALDAATIAMVHSYLELV